MMKLRIFGGIILPSKKLNNLVDMLNISQVIKRVNSDEFFSNVRFLCLK